MMEVCGNRGQKMENGKWKMAHVPLIRLKETKRTNQSGRQGSSNTHWMAAP